MKNTIKILILLLIISFQFTLGISLHVKAEGEIEIYTIEDLDEVRNNLSGSYILMNDLDFANLDDWEANDPYGGKTFEEWKQSDWNGGEGWASLGTNCSTTFLGEFNGQGFKIKNLYINKPDGHLDKQGKVGLFGHTSGIIRNTLVVDFDIKGMKAAGLAGHNVGTIENSYAKGKINGYYSEMLVFENEGEIIEGDLIQYLNTDNVIQEGDNQVLTNAVYGLTILVVILIGVIVIKKKN